MLAHPDKLALVTLEHSDLDVDFVGDIHELGRDEIYSGKGVHVIYRHHFCRVMRLCRVIRESCRKRCVKDKAGDRRVVGHIVIRVMGDYDIRVGVLYDLNDLIACLAVVVENIKVGKACAHDLDPGKRACLLCLRRADDRQLVRRDNNMTEISVRYMADNYRISPLHALCKCSGAGNFNIIGMRPDSKNSHISSDSSGRYQHCN